MLRTYGWLRLLSTPQKHGGLVSHVDRPCPIQSTRVLRRVPAEFTDLTAGAEKGWTGPPGPIQQTALLRLLASWHQLSDLLASSRRLCRPRDQELTGGPFWGFDSAGPVTFS